MLKNVHLVLLNKTTPSVPLKTISLNMLEELVIYFINTLLCIFIVIIAIISQSSEVSSFIADSMF